MTNRDLLKEAIADAKAVKEMAIANAKAALEEAFAPRLSAMLATKLEEMDNMDEEEKELAEMEHSKEEVEEMEDEMNEGDDEMYEAEDMEEEMDLDELLAEIEKEEDSKDMKEAEEMEAEEETETEEGEGDDEEEIDLEAMSEDDLKSFIEDVIADMVAAGELEAGDEAEGEEEGEGEEGEEEMDMNIDMGMEDETEIAEAEEEEVKEGDDEMMEMKKEIDEQKSELNEINLLNAKLLYVNKIFRSKNLTESQKSKVLAAFDKAGSVSEAKLVFETISENLTTKKEMVKENLSRASKPAGIAPKQPIVEIDSQVARWQRLAGIK